MNIPLIAIGSSAGGPGALASILRGLPADLQAAIVIVQHMDARFVNHMAKWLGDHSQLSVRVARNGDRPVAGTIFLSDADKHLVLSRTGTFKYIAEPAEVPYRPSVDVFFTSLVKYWHGPVVGVLLTGMGRDGAHGLNELRKNGSVTVVQDQSSSVVYGMPKAAVEMGAAEEILPLSDIGPRLIELVRKQSSPKNPPLTGKVS